MNNETLIFAMLGLVVLVLLVITEFRLFSETVRMKNIKRKLALCQRNLSENKETIDRIRHNRAILLRYSGHIPVNRLIEAMTDTIAILKEGTEYEKLHVTEILQNGLNNYKDTK